MEQVTLTRKELYDLVWAEPLSRLAKKYKISDNGLRKICKHMNIPIPAMGHWQKIQYGKRVIVTKLPTKYEGIDEITLAEKREGDTDVDSPIVQLRRLIQTIENTKGLPLKVPERMSLRPDNLIRSTTDFFDAFGRYYKSHNGSFPDRINVLNIQVQDESRPRALRLLDTIIKVLRSRKHDIIADHFTTYAKIGDEHVNFRLREKQRVSDIKTSYGGRQYESTDEYVFGAPLFNKVTMNFENGKKLVIEAPGNSKENIYVQNIKLNGKTIDNNFIRHSDLIKGGKLVFSMGPEPEKKRGTKEEAYPYSMSRK